MQSDGVSIKVTGLKDVQRRLYSFSRKLGDKVVIDSLKQGAKVVQSSAKSNVPVRSGRLKRSIVIRQSKIYSKRKLKTTGKLGVYLTIRKTGTKRDPGNAYYGSFVERGYKARGKASVPGRRFLEKAYLSQRSNAARVIINSAKRGADIVARKAGF